MTAEKHSPWQDIRRRLEARRAALNAEIAAYPSPIPACDAQFNHLLEERAGVAREIERLDALLAEGADDPERFVASCPFLSDAGGDARR